MIRHGDLEFELPKLLLLPGDGKHHRLAEDWHVRFRGEWYSVPCGFVTDGASIPAVLRFICGDPNKAPRIYPAILHDWGYSRGGSENDRRRYDVLYRDLQIALNIPRFKAYVEWLALRLCGWTHWNKNKKGEIKKMKKIIIVSCLASLVLTGCQTSITAEKYAEQVLPIQEVVKVNGEDQVITKNYQIASGGWYATARSPLYATEALEGLDLGVQTNGTVYLSLGKYRRDLSTNSVVMVEKMFSGGAQLVKEVGDAYVKIAGCGAQASTVMDVAAKAVNFFASKGGDTAKATVSADEAAKKLTITDGTTFVECTDAGVCTECQLPAAK